jgi:hypothetical protein
VRAEAPVTASGSAAAAAFSVVVSNTGTAPTAVPAGHPSAPASRFASDIYRVSVTVDGAGWRIDVQNALVAVRAGEAVRVLVFARRVSGTSASARVTVAIVSESDPTKRAVTVTTVK